MNYVMMSRHDDAQLIEEKFTKPGGETSVRKYTKGRLLGKGGFAKVFEAVNTESKQLFAIKVMEKSAISKARARQKFMSEIKIHKSLHHTNIVKFEGFFEDTENVYILLELCTNQTLNDLMRRRKRLTELEVQCYLTQIINSLKYLHAHRVIHRDIKLGNIFLSDKMEIKMGDFGLAAKIEFEGEKKRTICGTPNYIAPEILEGKSGHSYEVDIWSFGVLMYTMLIGKPPFETNDVKTTYRRIKMNAYTFPDHVTLSSEARNLIEKVLVSDPSSRLTLSQIEEHEFFTKNTFPKFLPSSTLAVPPSTTYTRQFEKPALRPLSRGREVIPKPKLPRSLSHVKEEPKSPTKKEDARAASGDRNGDSHISNLNKNPTVSQYVTTFGGPRIWLKKWIDCSSKYGLAFMFSNGFYGVYYNDSSKIMAGNDGKVFQYMAKNFNEDNFHEYDFLDYPQDLSKKVKLLLHFKKCLKTEDGFGESMNPFPYVKKWMVTSHAVIFRLSTKIVQVYFQDKSELMLCSDTKYVVYVNKHGEIISSGLINALDCGNKELSKRLRYTKEIITTMLPSNTKVVSPR
jgi:polo-like kinase 1